MPIDPNDPFGDLVPAQPQPQQALPPQAVAQPAQAQPAPAAQPDPAAAKLAFINQYVASGQGGYNDAQAAWDAGLAAQSMVTPAQQAYATAHAAQRDPSAPPGSSANPRYAYPSRPAQASDWTVGLDGTLIPPTDGDPFGDLVPKPSLRDDVLRTIPAAVARMGSALAGIPGDLLSAARAQGAAEAASAGQMSDADMQAVIANRDDINRMSHIPTSRMLSADIASAMPALGYQPRTWAGRLADTAVQLAPGAMVGPEGLIPRAMTYLAPVVASDAAGEVARRYAPQYEGAARMAASLVGGAGSAGALGPSGAAKVIVAGTEGLSDADLAAVQALRQKAETLGVPLTLGEAAAHVTGRPQPLLQAQRAIENTPAAASTFGPMMQARPAQMQGAVNTVFDQISPPVASPSMLGQNAQAAAGSLIDRAQAYRTELASPSYRAAAPQTVPQADMGDLMSRLDQQIAADKTGVLAKPLSDLRDLLTDNQATAAAQAAPGTAGARQAAEGAWAQATGSAPPPAPVGAAASTRVPLTDIESLDRVRKFVRDNTAASIGRGRLTPEQGSALNGYLDGLDQIMERASPAYVQGKGIYQQASQDYVTPLSAGPLGAISRSPNLTAQTSALFPAAPFAGSANETDQAMRLLAGDPTASVPLGGRFPEGQDTSIPAQLTRSFLDRSAAEAMQGKPGGANLYGGAQFAANVDGNANQAAAVRAGIQAVAPQAAGPYEDLVQALMATGKRLPPANATPAELAAAFKVHQSNPLESMVAAGVGKEAAGPLGVVAVPVSAAISKAAAAVAKVRAATNARALGEALTGSADQTIGTVQLARDAGATRRQALAQMLLQSGAQAAVQPPSR